MRCRPHKTTEPLERLYELVRSEVPALGRDRSVVASFLPTPLSSQRLVPDNASLSWNVRSPSSLWLAQPWALKREVGVIHMQISKQVDSWGIGNVPEGD
jgi:hypothetical protein